MALHLRGRVMTAPVDHEARCERIRDIAVEFAGHVGNMATEIERLRSALTASGDDLAAEIRVREILKTHIHELGDYLEHHESCPWRKHPLIQSCTCGLDALTKKGIAR